MDRRKYLKTLAAGAITTGVLLENCSPDEKATQETTDAPIGMGPDRQKVEIELLKKVTAEKFFDGHEMKTISLLCDIIIPKDEISGGAIDAKVPDFIEFIVKDMPNHQVPLRGGIKWLDNQCAKRFDKSFADCNHDQQIEIVDEIAFPAKAKPEMKQGVAFFNLMRDLTATGFFTSQIGIKDLGYMGNKANRWDGVPQEVLDQYGVKYDEKTLRESVKWET